MAFLIGHRPVLEMVNYDLVLLLRELQGDPSPYGTGVAREQGRLDFAATTPPWTGVAGPEDVKKISDSPLVGLEKRLDPMDFAFDTQAVVLSNCILIRAFEQAVEAAFRPYEEFELADAKFVHAARLHVVA
jgi:hypothetical protein